jgi:hypothetical protein
MDINSRLAKARQLFYDGESSKSVDALDAIVGDVSRLSSGDSRWEMYRKVQLYRALFSYLSGKKEIGREALRKVLRLDSQYQLNPREFPPHIVKDFGSLRKQIKVAPKSQLAVASSPDGADVYLDGFRVGRTPFTGYFLPGVYELRLAKGESSSFRRMVNLEQSKDFTVDLAFEGSFYSKHAFCLTSRETKETTHSNAKRLARWLGAERALVLRRYSPEFVQASLLSVDNNQANEAWAAVDEPSRFEELASKLVSFLLFADESSEVKVGEPESARAVDVSPRVLEPSSLAGAEHNRETAVGEPRAKVPLGLWLTGGGLLACVSGAALVGGHQAFQPGRTPKGVMGASAVLVSLGLVGVITGNLLLWTSPPLGPAPAVASEQAVAFSLDVSEDAGMIRAQVQLP